MALTLAEITSISGGRLEGDADSGVSVSEIGLDSTSLPDGGLFAALPGTHSHGAHYAAGCHAAAILSDAEGRRILADAGDTRPIIVVDDVRSVLGQVSDAIYDHPSRSFTLIGITGTSGKTTTSYMVEQGLLNAGYKVGLIGTTGTRINGEAVPSHLTTPEAPMLNRIFSHMRERGVDYVVMEVSSHALMLGRVAGVDFDVAAFTNLSQDHLDFHPTMEDYFEAKALFFDPASPQHARCSVVCVDDSWGARMAQRAGECTITVATHGESADVTATAPQVAASGTQRFELTIDNQVVEVTVPIPGRFNVANAAVAITCAHAAGADTSAVVHGIADVTVPGRMETIDEGQDFLAVVDYAHKPGAIAEVLDTLRGQVSGRIAAVIGAGGDRDSTKRPIMGAEAVKRADLVVITDDNPRSEDPAAIREQVARGAEEQRDQPVDGQRDNVEIRTIGGRRDAIRAAVDWAGSGDAIVVCGKGHETGQLINGVTYHFDDREEVREALRMRHVREERERKA